MLEGLEWHGEAMWTSEKCLGHLLNFILSNEILKWTLEE